MATETYQFTSSSNLDSGEYDPDAQTLNVTFKNGSTYPYDDITPQMWADLKAAPSAGRLFDEWKKAGLRPA